MPGFAKVVPESDLIQIDREFDFRVPSHLEPKIAVGQRVSFNLGRSKKAITGFVVELMDSSSYATSELLSIVSEVSVLTPEIYRFARAIADRQVVAIGEILNHAVPEHMPKVEIPNPIYAAEQIPSVDFPQIKLSGEISERTALLCSPRPVLIAEGLAPEWAIHALHQAHKKLIEGKSSIIIAPERDDVKVLAGLATRIGISQWVTNYTSSKKSEKFKFFHQILGSSQTIVIGTRSAVYAPASNLGLIAVIDDLDDSLRDEGSPFTHVRDLALIRAGEETSLLLIANYRSVEAQRLVDIGYLNNVESLSAPIRFSFSAPGQRIDAASFSLLKEQLSNGPLLVLVPRKGHSLAAFCKTCGERVRCKTCAGAVWQAKKESFECRLCGSPALTCHNCKSPEFQLGRAGSSRTVAELGKAFPNTIITEVTSDKPLGKLKANNQIVVATPGAIPASVNSFAGVLILDCDIWLSRESLRSEELAIRDWTDALAALHPNGRAVAAGMPEKIGKTLALGQYVAWAQENLSELRLLQLPPVVRTVSFEGSREVVEGAVSELLALGAATIRFNENQDSAIALMKFPYKIGPRVADALRQVSLKAAPRATNSGNRRGLRVVMDDGRAL